MKIGWLYRRKIKTYRCVAGKRRELRARDQREDQVGLSYATSFAVKHCEEKQLAHVEESLVVGLVLLDYPSQCLATIDIHLHFLLRSVILRRSLIV